MPTSFSLGMTISLKTEINELNETFMLKKIDDNGKFLNCNSSQTR